MDHRHWNAQGRVNAGGHFDGAGSLLTTRRRRAADGKSFSILSTGEAQEKKDEGDGGNRASHETFILLP